jgi:hypothetical protein
MLLIMRIAKIARITLGLILIVFGIHSFTGFLGGRVLSEEADAFLNCLESGRFVFPLLAIYAIVTGGLLIAEFGAPIAAVVSLLLVIAAVCFYVFFDFRGGLFAYISLVANIILFFEYKIVYRKILQFAPKKRPN